MVRVAVVDDHHAVRLGLNAALRSEPGLLAVGAAASAAELAPLLYRTRPDVVILDYHLPDQNGLALCWQIKCEVPAPAVLLYSAFADLSMTVPAIVAGADGVLHKGGDTRELFDAIRHAARGQAVLPPALPSLLAGAAARLEREDRPILDLLVARASIGEIAQALALDPARVRTRVARMLEALKVPVPEHTSR